MFSLNQWAGLVSTVGLRALHHLITGLCAEGKALRHIEHSVNGGVECRIAGLASGSRDPSARAAAVRIEVRHGASTYARREPEKGEKTGGNGGKPTHTRWESPRPSGRKNGRS